MAFVYEADYELDVPFGENTRGVHIVPIEDVPLKRLAALRVDSPKNNQLQRVRRARDYEIGTVAIGGPRGPSGAG